MGFFLFLFFLLVSTAGTLQQRAQPVEAIETIEVAPLAVVGVYGHRENEETALTTIRVMIELRDASVPTDLLWAIVRYSDGSHVQNYDYAEDDRANGFRATWVRGAGDDSVAHPGDLVELSFTPPAPLAPRTDVTLTIIPEAGSAALADFRTPATYGSDLVITLR